MSLCSGARYDTIPVLVVMSMISSAPCHHRNNSTQCTFVIIISGTAVSAMSDIPFTFSELEKQLNNTLDLVLSTDRTISDIARAIN